MLANLRRDLARWKTPSSRSIWWLEALLLDNGCQAVVFYRLASWFKRHGIPFCGPFFSRLGLFFTGADISASAEIGPGFKIAHGVGLVIGGYAKIGEDALLLHGVTIGSPSAQRVEAMPKIGDRVFIGAGASVIGAVEIGNDVKIGIGARVSRNIPDGCKVLPTPGIIVEPPAVE